MSDAINPEHYKQGSIQCIDAMEIVLTPEEYRGFLKGNAIKYLWREEHKNGIEDLRKAKWYLDRLIQLSDDSEDQPVIKQSSITEPPDGWRWLEVGEVIRKGDLPCKDGLIYATEPIMLGMALQEHWKPMIRRNKFEVGEKVVHVSSKDILEVVEVAGDVRLVDVRGSVSRCNPEVLAPYVEEQS